MLFLCITAAAIGLLVGSFLNVVIYRLPKMLERAWNIEAQAILGETPLDSPDPFNLSIPRSHCPSCSAQIGFLQNIPLFSFIRLGGKCGQCNTPISLQYPGIELLSAMLSLSAFIIFGLTPQLAFALFFTWALIALAAIDLKHFILPDSIVLPLLWLGLIANVGGLFTDLASAVLGAAAGYGVLWLCFWSFKLITGKDGMGYGDFKLMAAVGAWLGWQALPSILLLSSLSGSVVGVGMILLAKRDRHEPIPFGPFIAISGWLMLIFGQQIQDTVSQSMLFL